MSVILDTSLGSIVIDLYTKQCPLASKNFLKLCKIKYYHHCLIHNVQKDFIVQTGDPTGTGRGGESIFGKVYGEQARYFEDEIKKELPVTKLGAVCMANAGQPNTNGSQFFITTAANLHHLDGKHTVFGEVAEGFDTLQKINEAYCDDEGRPYQDIRIRRTDVLEDPFPDIPGMVVPERSPSPPKIKGRITLAENEEIDIYKGHTVEEIEEQIREKEAKSRAQVLEMIGDIPDADARPPEHVLFICKLNQVTGEDDLEVIFSRFGKIKSVEIIRDRKSGESLCYGFVEFSSKEEAEAAYFKMDGVLIDDRRIHVNFCQSIKKSRFEWEKKLGIRGGRGKISGDGDEGGGGGGQVTSRYALKDTHRQHGGGRAYDMVFDDDNQPQERGSDRQKEKSERKRSRSRSRERRDKSPRRDEKRRDRNDSDRRERDRDDRRDDKRDDRRRDDDRRDRRRSRDRDDRRR